MPSGRSCSSAHVWSEARPWRARLLCRCAPESCRMRVSVYLLQVDGTAFPGAEAGQGSGVLAACMQHACNTAPVLSRTQHCSSSLHCTLCSVRCRDAHTHHYMAQARLGGAKRAAALTIATCRERLREAQVWGSLHAAPFTNSGYTQHIHDSRSLPQHGRLCATYKSVMLHCLSFFLNDMVM